MAKQNDQHERNGSDRGGRRKSVSESGGRPSPENNAGRARHSTAEHNFRNAPHSVAETVANTLPLAILPGLFVAIFLWFYYFIFREEALPRRLAILAGIAVAYVLNSLFTIWFYGADKRLAEQQQRRIPEFHLHFWELFCGWPGALYAQKKYHHKWKKTSYMVAFWLYVVLNVAAVFAVAFPELAKSLLLNANDALMRVVGAAS